MRKSELKRTLNSYNHVKELAKLAIDAIYPQYEESSMVKDVDLDMGDTVRIKYFGDYEDSAWGAYRTIWLPIEIFLSSQPAIAEYAKSHYPQGGCE
jgi:hypothetical protein